MPNYARVINNVITELIRVDPDDCIADPTGWTRNQNRYDHPFLGSFIPWDHNIALANGYVGPTDLQVGDFYTHEGASA